MSRNRVQYVYWTDRSISDSLVIKNYLIKYFTEKEVNKFYKLLSSFEKTVSAFPDLYPKSAKNNKVHRSVLHKYLSVFYTISKDKISILSVLDNRMSVSKWP